MSNFTLQSMAVLLYHHNIFILITHDKEKLFGPQWNKKKISGSKEARIREKEGMLDLYICEEKSH